MPLVRVMISWCMAGLLVTISTTRIDLFHHQFVQQRFKDIHEAYDAFGNGQVNPFDVLINRQANVANDNPVGVTEGADDLEQILI